MLAPVSQILTLVLYSFGYFLGLINMLLSFSQALVLIRQMAA